MFRTVFVSLVAIFMAAQSEAQLRLGQPAYGGTGCPVGTASVTVAPDQSAISVLFDSYIAEAGRTNGRRMDRKTCNLTIPVAVPQGYSIAILKVDYRGYNSVPSGGEARFDAEYFWAGARGPTISRIFTGPFDDTFTLTDELIARTLVWTPCGASVNLRINTGAMVRSNSRMDQAMSQIDSADISSGLIYHFQWRRCR
jgi:hypothetical protein